MNTPRLFLIDGSGYLYRAFHGIRNLSRRDGFPTNAIFGFQKMMRKVVEEHQPDYLALVFDAKGPTFRNELDPNYKAHRPPMPDLLRAQVPVVKELVSAYAIPAFELAGFEADDILATLTRLGRAAGLDVVIVTGDKDMMQLVGPGVRLLDTMKEVWIDAPQVEERWGVAPERVTQVMALTGDTSDNIPGVPGIGEKTAAELIREFGDLETLLANTARVRQPRRRAMLETHADLARLSLRLVTVDEHVPLDVDLPSLRRQPPHGARLREIFKEMEFYSLLKELETLPEAEGGSPPAPEAASTPTDYHILTSMAEFYAFLEQLKRQPAFAMDTETTGLDAVQAELVGLSFAWKPRQGWYLPVAHTPMAAPAGQLDRTEVLDALRPLLEDPDLPKSGQNLKYEYVVLRKYGIRLAGIRRDAMLMSYLIHGTRRRHNLDAIAQDELGRTTIPYKAVTGTGKSQIRFDEVPLEKAGPYACEDAEVAWEAVERLEPMLTAVPEVERLHRAVELPLVAVLGEMELAGALIDRAALTKMSATLQTRRDALVEEIHALAGERFNVNSTQQLGEILFSRMGIKGGKKTKTGFSTDVSVLTRLAEEGHALPQKVLDYRTLTKLQSTYTDALLEILHPETGRVHTSYNQAVTMTGRLSSSDPNLQNIPVRTEEGRAIRTAFIAPPGHVLLSADYNQIELRLLAHMGEVTALREAFAAGVDVHSATAASLLGIPPAEVTTDQRRMAKTINFGLIYGMSAFGLGQRLGIPQYEAKRYMELYFKRYDGVQEYMMEAIRMTRLKGYAETILGRRCTIPEIDSSNRNEREFAERAAINAPLQGSAADLIKLAMVRLHGDLQQGGFKSRMILQVHDELVLEVPTEEVESVKPVIRAAMEGVMDLSVPLRVDMGVGSNWAEAH